MHVTLEVVLDLGHLPLLVLPVASFATALRRRPADGLEHMRLSRGRAIGGKASGIDMVTLGVEIVLEDVEALASDEVEVEGVLGEVAGVGGGGEALGDAAGGFGAADGAVEPDGVDFAQAAEGPDQGGEDVDAVADGEEARGDDGVALGLGFGAEHAVDELGAHLLRVQAHGRGVREQHLVDVHRFLGRGAFFAAVRLVAVALVAV